MKKILILSITLLFLASCSIVKADNDKIKTKKFQVTFTVQYNAITLQDAAEKEFMFRKLYKDACIVDVELTKESSGLVLTSSDLIGYYYTDNDGNIISSNLTNE